jgi:hypothetical protein
VTGVEWSGVEFRNKFARQQPTRAQIVSTVDAIVSYNKMTAGFFYAVENRVQTIAARSRLLVSARRTLVASICTTSNSVCVCVCVCETLTDARE